MGSTYSDETTKTIEEIDRLISLAEDVHKNIEYQRDSFYKTVSNASLTAAAFAMLFGLLSIVAPENLMQYGLFDNPFLITAITMGFLAIYVFFIFRSLRSHINLRIEKDILANLLDMVSAEISLVESKVRPIDLAVMKMRARRISFSSNRPF